MKRLIPVGFTAVLVMASLAGETSSNPACGACSVSVCQGAEDGTVCGFRNGETLYCRPTGPLCQDGLPVADFRCTCTSSIVP